MTVASTMFWNDFALFCRARTTTLRSKLKFCSHFNCRKNTDHLLTLAFPNHVSPVRLLCYGYRPAQTIYWHCNPLWKQPGQFLLSLIGFSGSREANWWDNAFHQQRDWTVSVYCRTKVCGTTGQRIVPEKKWLAAIYGDKCQTSIGDNRIGKWAIFTTPVSRKKRRMSITPVEENASQKCPSQ